MPSSSTPLIRLASQLCLTFALLMGGSAEAAPIVHAGDTLSVTVLNYAAIIDDSSGRLKSLQPETIIVAGDGSISFPIAGTIHVAGMSTREIAAIVRRRLGTYIRQPNVNVTLVQQAQQIFLTGATTGTLPFLPGETISSVLGQLREQLEKDLGPALSITDKNGGTLLRTAIDIRRVFIERDGRKGASINGEALLRSGLPGPAIMPDDTILFATKPILVSVRGQVAAPGPTYLYSDETLEQAVLQAGGILPTAATSSATLVREGVESPLPLGGAALRQPPQNGDVIIVRAAPHVTVIGQVSLPGELTLKNGSTLLNALYEAGGPTKWANVKDIQVIHSGSHVSYDLRGLQHGDVSMNVPLADGDVVYVPEGHKIDASLFIQALGTSLGGFYDATHL